MHFRGIFFYFILCYLPFLSFAQDNGVYPVQFSPLWSNYALINPASSSIANKVELNTAYRSQMGQFRGIDRFYVNGSINLTDDTLYKNKNVIGLNFFNEKDGDIITKNRVYASYAWHTRVTRQWSLGAGLALGFDSYSFKGTAISPGASDYKTDGNLGFWCYSERTTIGLSIDQLFNNTLVPKFYKFSFSRYANLNITHKFFIGPYTYLLPTLQLRWLKDQQDIDIGTSIVLRDLFVVGANYKIQKEASLLVGLRNVPLGKTIFNLAFNYNRSLKIDQFESIDLSLNYYIK